MEKQRASEQPGQDGKKPYVPPTMDRVPLRPEEAVLGFCKSNHTHGPLGVTCQAAGKCSTQGS
jgi:hypothetical protein